MKAPKRPLLVYWLSALCLWLLLLAAFAAWAFLAPHPPHFAPEIGVFASFIFFSTIYSAIYWLAVFLISPIWHGVTSYLRGSRD